MVGLYAARKIDLVGLLRERFGVTTADELGIRQASNLIDELKSDEPTASPSRNGHTNSNGAYSRLRICCRPREIAHPRLVP